MLQNFLQVLSLFIILVGILFATYYVTKWIAKSGSIQNQAKNIKVIETFKIAPNKYIQIIRLGNRYYSIAVTKEQVTFLTALEEEQLDFSVSEKNGKAMSFKELFASFSKSDKRENKEK